MRAKLLATLALGLFLVFPTAAKAAEPDAVRNLQWQISALDLVAAQKRSTGTGITVAVLDSGVDPTHPDLTGQVQAGLDAIASSDVDGRGTGMAGLIAGHGHEVDKGVLGVAPGASILPISIVPADPDRVAAGIRTALSKGARIICIGRGVGPSALLQLAVDDATDRGALVIAVDGDKPGVSFTPWPASYGNVLTALPTDRTGTVVIPSASGRLDGLAVPGSELITPAPGGTYRLDSGPSGWAATAVLAGSAALVWSAFPYATGRQIAQLLRSTAVDRGLVGQDSQYGAGAVNVTAALVKGVPISSPSPTAKPSASGAPAAPTAKPSVQPSATPQAVVVALADSAEPKRWLVVLPLIAFLVGLPVWAFFASRRRSSSGTAA